MGNWKEVVTMCRHCVINPRAGSSKMVTRKGCFEENAGKSVQFYPPEQTKVRQRSARMTMGGSGRRMMRREKDGGGWLSWKQAIQQTTLQEDHLRDLMLSQYSYASIPYQHAMQVDPADWQADEGENLEQEKEEKGKLAIQVEERRGLQKRTKRTKKTQKAKDEVKGAGGGKEGIVDTK